MGPERWQRSLAALAVAVFAVVQAGSLGGCTSRTLAEPGSLAGVRAGWFYPPGPRVATLVREDGSRQRAVVGGETAEGWSVRIGPPGRTIRVVRLADGRPASALVADAERGETLAFDPPLALVPKPAGPGLEEARVRLYVGEHDLDRLEGLRPVRTGRAVRRFLAVQPAQWQAHGRTYPAQRLEHELALELGPARIVIASQSVAVEGLGIVWERVVERVVVLGVTIRRQERQSEAVGFEVGGPEGDAEDGRAGRVREAGNAGEAGRMGGAG
ncbi:MAG: hypothetical protein KatS3mg103_0165 [Phycisphaerales bacterium]|nr:MAG: hypothetical protein KatS3mg103_0165 [Phycisphaerales bacterium]